MNFHSRQKEKKYKISLRDKKHDKCNDVFATWNGLVSLEEDEINSEDLRSLIEAQGICGNFEQTHTLSES